MTGEGPLAGRTILILRPEERGKDLAARLEALGARSLLRPAISFQEPSDPEPACRAVRDLDRYELLVFTSSAGVHFFLKILRSVRADTWLPRATVVAVGPATERSLREAGFAVELVASDSRAEGLAELLRAKGVEGKHVLVVRPEATRELLPEALGAIGARVDAVPFYRTVAAREAREAAEEVARGGVDAVVFTSPSTFQCLREAGKEAPAFLKSLRRAVRIAIGPVTAAALEDGGLSPDAVCDSPSSQAIVEAVLQVLGR